MSLQFVHTIGGPNVGPGTSSVRGSALRIVRWCHCQHDTSSDRTPLARMLPGERKTARSGGIEQLASLARAHRRASIAAHHPALTRIIGPREAGIVLRVHDADR